MSDFVLNELSVNVIIEIAIKVGKGEFVEGAIAGGGEGEDAVRDGA